MRRIVVPLLIAALATAAAGNGDEHGDLSAALARDPERMTLEELRAQAELLAAHPAAVFRKRYRGARVFGAADLPHLFAAARDLSEPVDSEAFFDLHRVMVPDAIPALVRELPRAGPDGFGPLAGLFDTSIGCTDRHREIVFRALLWKLAREREEEPPALDEISAEIPACGLPEGFRKLVERAWEVGAEQRNVQAWLRRWSRELTPAAEDLPFLLEQVEWVSWIADRGAFIRLIGKIPGPRATEALEKLAGEQADFAVFAAAELARRGNPKRFLELLKTADRLDPTEALAFEVLPGIARLRWMAAFTAGDPDRPPLHLDAEARDELESLWGVRIGAETLDRLAVVVLLSHAPLERIVEFFVFTHPDAFVGAALDEIAERMAAYDPSTDEESSHWTWQRALGYLEVRAPERLAEVLKAWKPKLDEDDFLLLTGAAGEMDLILSEDDSLHTKAVRSRAPRAIRELLWRAELPRLPEEVRAEARTLLDEGDPVGAALRLLDAQENPRGATALRSIDDPRVVPFLHRLVEERRGRWAATAALAARGEKEARREWIGVVRDARMFVLYEFECEAASLWGDPELVPLWIDRLDAPCCVANHAQYALKGAFPTLECDDVPWAYPIVRRRIAAWYERHRGSFRESRILCGLVPAR